MSSPLVWLTQLAVLLARWITLLIAGTHDTVSLLAPLVHCCCWYLAPSVSLAPSVFAGVDGTHGTVCACMELIVCGGTCQTCITPTADTDPVAYIS
jgi:hypothetical protein